MGEHGEAVRTQRSGEGSAAGNWNTRSGTAGFMEQVVARAATSEANKDSPDSDGMTAKELPNYLREHWPAIRAQLLAGTYQPPPVKRQAIPKSGSGECLLGIVSSNRPSWKCCSPQFDPTFSHACGFRPGRRARMTRFSQLNATSRPDATGGWQASISRNSSTGSTTTC